MKDRLILSSLLLSLFVSSLLCPGPAQAVPTYTRYSEYTGISVREMTAAQLARHGRELYRKGDFAASAKVFEHLLTLDCGNTIAQYHLQKIAAKGPDFQEASAFLKALPCRPRDFSEEDFLPASLYYEKDEDLLLAQIATYNRRYRDVKDTLGQRIGEYALAAETLSQKAAFLTSELSAAQKTAAEMAPLKAQLEESKALCARMSSDVTRLQQELAASREAQPENAPTLRQTPGTAPSPAQVSAPEAQKSASAPDEQKTETDRKARELETLRHKFAEVQKRLARIEADLIERNRRLEELNKELTDIQQ